MFGMSHGLVEGVINPLMASLYTDEKTRRITSVHAWWPAGLVIGGLLAVGMSRAGIPWEAKLALVFVPAVVYLVMALSLRYPQTERAVSNVSTAEMWGAGHAAALPGADGLHVDDGGDRDGARSVVSDGDGRPGAAAQSRRRQRRAVPGLHRRPDVRAAHVGQRRHPQVADPDDGRQRLPQRASGSTGWARSTRARARAWRCWRPRCSASARRSCGRR